MGCNGDLKIIFYITNTLTWLVPGIMLFSFSVGVEVLTRAQDGDNIRNICVGLLMMLVALQGYCGANSGKKKTVNCYMSICTLKSVAVIVMVSLTCRAKPGITGATLEEYSTGYTLMISYTIICLINWLLGCAVAGQCREEETVAVALPGPK